MVTAFPIPMSDIRRRKRADDRLLLILLLAPGLRLRGFSPPRCNRRFPRQPRPARC